MKITPIQVTVADLTKNYKDDGDGGVYGYDGKLCIRPSFQREFVYSNKQRNLVIDSICKDRPLNVMYWSKIGEDAYEVLDGQQRTISIAQYVNKDFPIKINGNDKFFHNLTETERNQILNYELTVYICEGTDEEKLEWFEIINIAGAVLTKQELLNATYTGPWLSDAKKYFSKTNCAAKKISDKYVKGNPIRQELLEKTLLWIADRDKLESGQRYMAMHQNDKDADDLWQYFQDVINWAKKLFPNEYKGVTEGPEYGILYNKYHNNKYNVSDLDSEIKKLCEDDEITKHSGIIPYILSDKTKADEKYLSLRSFTNNQKMRAYEKQDDKCYICHREFPFEEMQGDHIIPWSKGGKTIDSNLQMLCRECNNEKSDK